MQVQLKELRAAIFEAQEIAGYILDEIEECGEVTSCDDNLQGAYLDIAPLIEEENGE